MVAQKCQTECKICVVVFAVWFTVVMGGDVLRTCVPPTTRANVKQLTALSVLIHPPAAYLKRRIRCRGSFGCGCTGAPWEALTSTKLDESAAAEGRTNRFVNT